MANTSELLVVLITMALVRILRAPVPTRRAGEWRRAASIGALAAAALLAKESGLLALPLAAITAWGWRPPGRRPAASDSFWMANARAWAAALVGLVAVVCARSVALGTPVAHSAIAAQGIIGLSAPHRVVEMLSLWPRIAMMIVWPASLSPYYGPTIFPTHAAVLACLSVLAAIVLVASASTLAARGETRPLVAVAWVVLTYFPASNLATATGQILSDRTLFGVTVGVALALAWVLDTLPHTARLVTTAACAVVIARGAIVTTRYAVAWTSHRALWGRMIESVPREHLGYKLLGIDARARGDTTRALEMLERAFTMAPADRQIRFEYGQVLYQTRRYDAAAAVLAPLAREGDALAERGFVVLYLDAVGRSRGPAAVVTAATPLLHSASSSVAALYLGLGDEQLGKWEAADSAYTVGLRRSPGDSALTARLAQLRASARGR